MSAALDAIFDSLAENEFSKVNTNNIVDVWVPAAKRLTEANCGLPQSDCDSISAVIRSWSGIAWDSSREQILAMGGGHFSYPGNEGYVFDIATLAWQRNGLPSAIETVSNFGDGDDYIIPAVSASSTVANYVPTASHTYKRFQYIPWLDKYLYVNPSDYYANSASRYAGADMSDTSARLNSGPFLIDPTKFDPNKTVGADGTGVDPTDLGAEIYENRDWHQTIGVHVATRSVVVDNINQRIFAINESANKLQQLIVSADGSADQVVDLKTVANANTVVQGVYVPHLDAVVYVTQNGLSCVPVGPGYDVYFPYTNISDPDTLAFGTEAGIEYDADRRVIILWQAGYNNTVSAVWELDVPDIHGPSGWVLRKTEAATGPTGGPAGNNYFVSGKWINVGGNRWIGVINSSDGTEVGQVWAYKSKTDKPRSVIHKKSELSLDTQLKTLTGLTPLAVLPFMEGAGATTKNFADGSSLSLNDGAWEILSDGQTVINGGLILPDLGTKTDITVVAVVYRDVNKTGSIYDYFAICENPSESCRFSFAPESSAVQGSFIQNANFFSNQRAPWDRLVIAMTQGGGVPARICIGGGDVFNTGGTVASTDLSDGLHVFERATASLDTSHGVFFALYDGSATDTQLQALSLNPFEQIFDSATTTVDDAPNAFTVADVTAAEIGSEVISDPVVVSGINTTIPASVTDAEMSLDGGPWNAGPAIVGNGSQIRLKVTAPGTYTTTLSPAPVLTIGSQSDTWTVTTEDEPVIPFPTGWERKCAITVNSALVQGSDKAGFVAIITDAMLPAGMLDGGADSAANGGGDVRASLDSAGATEIPVDPAVFVVDATPANRKAKIKIYIPSLAGSADTTVYLWWKNAGVSHPDPSYAYARKEVYQDRAFQVNFNDSSGAPTDAAGNVTFDTSSAPTYNGDGTASLNSALHSTDTAPFDTQTGYRYSYDSTTAVSIPSWVSVFWAYDGSRHWLTFQRYGSSNEMRVFHNGSYSPIQAYGTLNGLTGKVDICWDGSTVYVYTNGTLFDSVAQSAIAFFNTTEWYALGVSSSFVSGTYQDLFFDNQYRDADWIATEQNNRDSEAAFWSVGSIETASSSPVTVTASASLSAIFKQQGLLRAAAADAILRAQGLSSEAGLDSVLKLLAVNSSVSLDTLLRQSRELLSDIDVVLKRSGLSEGLAFDAILSNPSQLLANLSAVLKGQSVRQASVDAMLRLSFELNATVGAILQKRLNASVGVDSILSDPNSTTVFASINSILQQAVQVQGSLSAILKSVGDAESAALDAYLSMQVSRSASLDALLIAMSGVSASLNAVIKNTGIQVSAAVDAILSDNTTFIPPTHLVRLLKSHRIVTVH